MRDQQHRDPPTSGFSRRAFLKGSGAAAAATALAQGPQIALAQDDKVQAKGWKTIELNVNGKSQKVKVENRTTLLEALRYGAPPHAGIALGLDRWVMMFGGSDNIRDVIAFPKTQKASDLLTGAPSEVDRKQLRDLHIKIDAPAQ